MISYGLDAKILSRTRKVNQIFLQINKTRLGKKEVSKYKDQTNKYNTVVLQTMNYWSETWPMISKQDSKVIAARIKYRKKSRKNKDGQMQ